MPSRGESTKISNGDRTEEDEQDDDRTYCYSGDGDAMDVKDIQNTMEDNTKAANTNASFTTTNISRNQKQVDGVGLRFDESVIESLNDSPCNGYTPLMATRPSDEDEIPGGGFPAMQTNKTSNLTIDIQGEQGESNRGEAYPPHGKRSFLASLWDRIWR